MTQMRRAPRQPVRSGVSFCSVQCPLNLPVRGKLQPEDDALEEVTDDVNSFRHEKESIDRSLSGSIGAHCGQLEPHGCLIEFVERG